MSSRALRKLQGGGVSPLGGAEGRDSGEDESLESVKPRTNAFNAFSLLNNDSCSESEVKEDDDVESARNASPSLQIEKKKKKRKKKTGKKLAARSSEDNLDPTDEVEASVRWVEENVGQPVMLRKDQKEEKVNPLKKVLSIENKHLNPENEMKRIFGSRVVASESSRHKKVRGRPHHRSCILVTPKPAWPSAARSGLSMRPVDSSQGGSWFTLDHSPTYQATQMRFLSAVESLNPDLIVALLNTHPMHIDSMLQLSDICKMGDDSAMAAELVERTLYALESSFHPCFSLASGTSHLDYKRQENRALFIALFRHLHFVGSRACYRTALEICKVLLVLDPTVDPLAIVLLIDFYALRARQNQWLIDLYTAWNPTRNLSQLPNFSFSTALATFHLAQETNGDSSMALTISADSLLQEALLSFPSVLLPLLDKCSIEPHPDVMGCKYFLDTRSDPPALATLCTLYVSRTFHCWKEPEILPWLEKNVMAVLERIKTGDARVSESIQERSTRYQGLPRNIHRHIIMSDIKEALSHLPPELKEVASLAWDPLPPLNSINTYVAPARQPTAIDDPSALRMFFRSLLPNFNPADPLALPPGDVPAGAEGGAGGGGADLRNSVNSLLDAMRDLLGNLQLPEVPNEAEDEASEGEEERDPREWD